MMPVIRPSTKSFAMSKAEMAAATTPANRSRSRRPKLLELLMSVAIYPRKRALGMPSRGGHGGPPVQEFSLLRAMSIVMTDSSAKSAKAIHLNRAGLSNPRPRLEGSLDQCGNFEEFLGVDGRTEPHRCNSGQGCDQQERSRTLRYDFEKPIHFQGSAAGPGLSPGELVSPLQEVAVSIQLCCSRRFPCELGGAKSLWRLEGHFAGSRPGKSSRIKQRPDV